MATHASQRNPSKASIPSFLTIQEVMDALRISRDAVYDMLADGQLDSVKIRRSRRITRESFDRYLESVSG